MNTANVKPYAHTDVTCVSAWMHEPACVSGWCLSLSMRVSEGGSRRVPVSLACDGTMYACTCLNEDVECLPSSVRAV